LGRGWLAQTDLRERVTDAVAGTGLGDVTPLNTAGEVWLTIEVITGYIMLGGLISIFANKLARRA